MLKAVLFVCLSCLDQKLCQYFDFFFWKGGGGAKFKMIANMAVIKTTMGQVFELGTILRYSGHIKGSKNAGYKSCMFW